MSEVEGEWAELLHESALEAATAQASANPVSVPEPDVTLPQRTRYTTSPSKGKTLATMARFFGPVGSAASGAGKALVTRTTKFMASVEGKMVQVQESKTVDIETVADPKYGNRTCGSSLLRRYFMPGTTRTGRDGWRGGCIGATSTCEISLVPPLPILLCDTLSH